MDPSKEHRAMTRKEAQRFIPRLLNGVLAIMSATDPSLRQRLAWGYMEFLAFAPGDIPEDVREEYDEIHRILSTASVPKPAENHPHYPKATPVAYLSPRKAQRLAELMSQVFSKVVYALADESEVATAT